MNEELYYRIVQLRSTTDRVAELMAEEYNATSIATVLGMSSNHVRVSMTRIRRKMGEGPNG